MKENVNLELSINEDIPSRRNIGNKKQFSNKTPGSFITTVFNPHIAKRYFFSMPKMVKHSSLKKLSSLETTQE